MMDLSMISTYILGITVLVSFLAFNNTELRQKLIFNPFIIRSKNEYYRFITSGLIHADWVHLIFNMIVIFYFSFTIEGYYLQLFDSKMIAKYYFLFLYIGGLIISDLPSYFKHKDNYYYNSLGASGATSSVLFAFILFQPWSMLYFFGIIPIPAILFGLGFLWYSSHMSKKATDNINHDAHFYGAVWGILFTLIIKPEVGLIFLNKLLTF